jgi:hypothetical protein
MRKESATTVVRGTVSLLCLIRLADSGRAFVLIDVTLPLLSRLVSTRTRCGVACSLEALFKTFV